MQKNIVFLLSMLFVASLAATVGIEPYKKERDNAFINSLIIRYKNHFVDADIASNLDTPYIDLVVPLADGNQVPMRFQQKISVFCVDSKPVGFVRIFMVEGAPLGIVAQIAVLPEHQHKGYGAQLLKKALEQLKAANVQQVVLDALQDNTVAQHMYTKAGFQKIAEGEGRSFFMLMMQ